MVEQVLVLGELHQDLYYESDFYEQLVNKIVEKLFNFIRYNPDDLNNKRLLERLVKQAFSTTPKKIIGECYFKRGGNGNNSSEYLAKLGIPTKLISVIGRGSEWMYPELESLGINTEAVYQIDEITPVSTIIKSKFTTKIHLAPNLKNKMNFDGLEIEDNIFTNAKLIFSTPIAEKFIKIFERAYDSNLITAFNIETQKVSDIKELSDLIKRRYDLFFLNLNDAHRILNQTGPIEKIDDSFKRFAKIRVYTAGKEGSHIITDHFNLFFPGVEIKDIIDRTGAGDCYAAGFLTKLCKLIRDKNNLNELLNAENSKTLEKMLYECGKYGTYTAIYKITKQLIPSEVDIDNFIETFKLIEL